jgi:hypothetical protein
MRGLQLAGIAHSEENRCWPTGTDHYSGRNHGQEIRAETKPARADPVVYL